MFSGKQESKNAQDEARYAVVRENTRLRSEVAEAKRQQALARRKAEYQELEVQIASGNAIELKQAWIQLVSGNGEEFLLENDSLSLLHELIESGTKETVKFRAWQANGSSFTVRLRSEILCYIEEPHRNRWILMDGAIHYIPEDDLVEFKEMERTPGVQKQE